jgi:hypothetical protein
VTSVSGFFSEFHSQETFREDLFLTFEALVEMVLFCPWILTWHCGNDSWHLQGSIYSLYYRRRLLSLIYGRCVYKMNVILHENTHAAVVYTLALCCTVTTTQNSQLGRQAATDCQTERRDRSGLAPRWGKRVVTCDSSEVEWLDGAHWQADPKSYCWIATSLCSFSSISVPFPGITKLHEAESFWEANSCRACQET